ncbi:hypothetical protein DFH29DRAFT_420375 [Suillus ampliporus]|nr:hypothetical protein DFH29DRAFT_420375 [Suillus ampliporus]
MDLIYRIPFNRSSPLESSIDDFYKSIISTSDDLKEAYLHLTIVANLAGMLSCSQLDGLLSRTPNQKFDMCSVLPQLSPLVHIPDGHDSAAQVCHESLFDFLSDRLRCGEQFISPAVAHRLLAYSSLSVMMEELPDDIALCSRLSRLATESSSPWLGFDLAEVAAYSPPEPLPFLSTLWRIIQYRYSELTADPRAKLAMGYFCCTWQILQHLDFSSIDTLPVSHFLGNIQSLPVLLAFPIFLSFESPGFGETLGPSTLEHKPRIETLDAVAEIVNDIHAFKEQSRTDSGALDYACTHWAYHLSLAEWDGDLRSILMAFMKKKLQQWLVKAWCLQDFETCLRTLCEVEELCLTANPPIHFDSDAQRTDANMKTEREAEGAVAARWDVAEAAEFVMREGGERIRGTVEAGKTRADEAIVETEVERTTAENDGRETTSSKEGTSGSVSYKQFIPQGVPGRHRLQCTFPGCSIVLRRDTLVRHLREVHMGMARRDQY